MKVLVTGATGFIGRYVVQHLENAGHHIITTSAKPENAATCGWLKKTTYLPLDLSKFDNNKNYYEYFHEPDVVIHLAWEGLPNYNSLFHFEVNLPRHYYFLKSLVVNGAKDITVTGTCFEYGMQEGRLSENMQSLPANPYAIAKDTLRKFLEQLQVSYPFSLKWSRLFYMYGQGQNPNSLFSLLNKAIENGDKEFNMSAGDQLRDYLPVEKIASYIVRIALQKNVEGIINCCSGLPVSVSDVVENYLQENNATIKLNKGFYPYSKNEPKNFWGDVGKLEKVVKG